MGASEDWSESAQPAEGGEQTWIHRKRRRPPPPVGSDEYPHLGYITVSFEPGARPVAHQRRGAGDLVPVAVKHHALDARRGRGHEGLVARADDFAKPMVAAYRGQFRSPFVAKARS